MIDALYYDRYEQQIIKCEWFVKLTIASNGMGIVVLSLSQRMVKTLKRNSTGKPAEIENPSAFEMLSWDISRNYDSHQMAPVTRCERSSRTICKGMDVGVLVKIRDRGF